MRVRGCLDANMAEDGSRQEALFPFDIDRLPSSSKQRRLLSLRITSRYSTESYGKSQMKRLVRMNDGSDGGKCYCR